MGAFQTIQCFTATVLLVDDDRNLLRALRTVLEAEGYRVLTADNGEPAMALAIGESPNIVVTDYMMPGVDGIEFCRQLRTNLTTVRVPVVLLTAVFPLPSMANQPWNVLLRKPVSVRDLLATISFLLAKDITTVPARTVERVGQRLSER